MFWKGFLFQSKYERGHVQNVLCYARNVVVTQTFKNIGIFCGTSNINNDSPDNVTNVIITLGLGFREKSWSESIVT